MKGTHPFTFGAHHRRRTSIQTMKGRVPFTSDHEGTRPLHFQSLGPKWCPSPGEDDHTV
jgi:hypothetical protein